MAIPTWSSAVPGQATLAGQVNQFVVAHQSTLMYDGTAFASGGVPAATSDTFTTTTTKLALRFQSPSSTTTLTRVTVGLGYTTGGLGCDVLLSLQSDSGSGPSGTVLASCTIPAEWLSAGVQPGGVPDCGFPLAYTLSPLTYYNIVLTPIAPWTNIDDVVLTRTSATSGAYTYNSSTSTWTAQAYGYTVTLYSGSSGYLRVVSEDNGSMLKGYSYTSGSMSTARQWTAQLSSAPFNLISRSDSSFASGVGTYTATNATIARSNGTTDPAIDGSYSLKLTVSGTPASASASTNRAYYAATAGQNYSALAYVAPAATPLRNVSVQLSWYNSAGTLISTSSGASFTQTAANTFTKATISATAPASTAYVSLAVVITPASGTLATGEIHYIDNVALFAGSTSIWSYPGAGLSSTRTLTFANGLLATVS